MGLTVDYCARCDAIVDTTTMIGIGSTEEDFELVCWNCYMKHVERQGE
jgi:hypothetical protein